MAWGVAEGDSRLGADREALSHATADRPAAFSVTAKWLPRTRYARGSRARGELLVSPGAVVFVPSGLTSRLKAVGEFSHAAPSITLTTVRSRMPWARAFVVLENDGSFIRVRVSALTCRRMCDALRASGLAVKEETSRQAPRLPGPHTA